MVAHAAAEAPSTETVPRESRPASTARMFTVVLLALELAWLALLAFAAYSIAT
jgi:hypothetical protein